MATAIFGNGNLGRAIAAGIVARGDPPPLIFGRPLDDRGRSSELDGADLVFEASRAEAVVENLGLAVAAGCRRIVVATTGWAVAHAAVDDLLRSHDAAAVVASNFSPGVALFHRLIDAATELFGSLEGYDPYVVEWHRRDKPDRPSGTALEIASRVIAIHPVKTRLAAATEAPAADELEVISVRAGRSPGVHQVGFDGPGESIELRLAARDRSAYVAGVLAAADWLCRTSRPPGIHAFEPIVDELLARSRSLAGPGAADVPGVHRHGSL